MSGEPFVTNGPCQFDAYDMVEPANYLSNGCGPAGTVPYTGVPGAIVPPTIMPNQAPYGLYPRNSLGHRPLIGFGQDNYNVELGRGIFGQPVAYAEGQPIRNFIRYIFP